MSGNGDNYFLACGAAELKMAKVAECPEPIRAHHVMAGHYLDGAAHDLDAPRPHQASPLPGMG